MRNAKPTKTSQESQQRKSVNINFANCSNEHSKNVEENTPKSKPKTVSLFSKPRVYVEETHLLDMFQEVH